MSVMDDYFEPFPLAHIAERPEKRGEIEPSSRFWNSRLLPQLKHTPEFVGPSDDSIDHKWPQAVRFPFAIIGPPAHQVTD